MEGSQPAVPRLGRLSSITILLAPIRVGCALTVLVPALLLGHKTQVELLAFGLGAVLCAALVLGDPRRRHRRRPELEPLPVRIELQPWQELALTHVYPSTVGVTALGLLALVLEPTLAALLAGVLAGMAAASVVAWLEIISLERRLGARLFGRRGLDRLYVG
jgi:hypothetical protein